MKLKNKGGYILWDSLAGLTLFALLLILYLPAYYQEIARMAEVKRQSDQWRLFAQLSMVEANEDLTIDQKQVIQADMIKQSSFQPLDFYWSNQEAFIVFPLGERKHVYKISE